MQVNCGKVYLFFPGLEPKMKHSDWLTNGPEFQNTDLAG